MTVLLLGELPGRGDELSIAGFRSLQNLTHLMAKELERKKKQVESNSNWAKSLAHHMKIKFCGPGIRERSARTNSPTKPSTAQKPKSPIAQQPTANSPTAQQPNSPTTQQPNRLAATGDQQVNPAKPSAGRHCQKV